MSLSTGDPSTGTRSDKRKSSPFRYSAAIAGTGEAHAIQQFIGRRLVRQIDPCSRLGRRLLTSGQVALWCEPVVEGERLPVADVLARLQQQVQHQMEHAQEDPDRCRDRLRAIEDWRTFYDE